jgi:hypothetical protein
VKLHQAIDAVLAGDPDGLTAKEIADEIERRGLYVKPSDGNPAPASQIAARVGNKTYRDKYRKDENGRITKRFGPDDDQGPASDELASEPRGYVGRLLAAMSKKYGPAPETFTFGDGIDWSSPLEPIPLYVELPFWLMMPPGDLDVEWAGASFRVNVMRPWMEVFAVEVLDSRRTCLHQGPWGRWKPPPGIAADLKEEGVPLISHPCKTVIRLNTRAHVGAFRKVDPETEPPRVNAEQRAYWASLCEAHIPVLNELIQRYRLATYDYFAYEVSAWDVPVWYFGYGELARMVLLLPYKEWDSKPTLIKDGEKPEDPPVRETFQFATAEDLADISSEDATPGEFDLLDARNRMERGDYTGAVRRTVTAIEAVTEWALRGELEKKHTTADVDAKLAMSENDWPGRFRQWRKLANPRITDGQVTMFEATRQIRHDIVHNGRRLTHDERGEAQKCVDTGRWFYNRIEQKPDRERLREFGGLNRSVGRSALDLRFPSTVDADGITLGPFVFATPTV